MAKEFNRSGGKSFNDKQRPGFKKSKPGKNKRKPAFERFRDEARPSDFENTKHTFSSTQKSSFKKRKNSSPFSKRWDEEEKPFKKEKKTVNPFDLDESDLEYDKPKSNHRGKKSFNKEPYRKRSSGSASQQKRENDGTIRLNKYLSNAGICSRREADELIASGVVQVNGKTITEMGFKVKPTDIVKYGGQTLKKEKMVYLLLNKPKDYITTLDDPEKRKTVLELIHGACKERVYPVGRLDRATTGLLMFTNDGELTKKLTHPRYGVRKIYHVELDKPLKHQDFQQIAEGIELEDGPVKVDEIAYAGNGSNKKEIGIELHSGRNRIVRRIFEHFGYNVRKLDRVVFGPLTKKDMPRGRWRFLTEAEVGMLKMIGEKASS